jgi:protein involved in polysaccharide export with SLBB domain
MKSNRKVLNLVAALSVIMGLSAMVKAQAPSLPGSPVEQPSDRYRIGPGDVLDVRVYNRPQLSREANPRGRERHDSNAAYRRRDPGGLQD